MNSGPGHTVIVIALFRDCTSSEMIIYIIYVYTLPNCIQFMTRIQEFMNLNKLNVKVFCKRLVTMTSDIV